MSEAINKDLVDAVGLSFISPEVVLLIADKSAYHLHFYPAKADHGKSLDLSERDRPHWVLLKSPEHLSALLPYAARIHRLIVFGQPEELLGLGLPILDASVNTNGTVEVQRRSSRDEMLASIDRDAVKLALAEVGATYDRLKKREQNKMERKPSGKTFFQQLKELKTMVGKGNPNLNFITQVGIPAIMRIMGDSDRESFKLVCKVLVDRGKVSDAAARGFFRWVEGFDGEGVELGKAVDALLYPKQDAAESLRGEAEWTDALTRKIAKQFSVDEGDLVFVARSYAQLLEENKKVAVKPSVPEEDEGGFPTEELPDDNEPVDDGLDDVSVDEQINAASMEDAGPSAEPDEFDSDFGWPEDNDAAHPDAEEEDEQEEEEAPVESDDDNPDFSDFV